MVGAGDCPVSAREYLYNIYIGYPQMREAGILCRGKYNMGLSG
jgi:hypothetical protein